MNKKALNNNKKSSWAYKVLFAVILIYFGLFFYQKIHFVNADLGRFIQNGAVFFDEFNFLKTNHYSYTQPDHFFGNHHWGVGVIYYLVQKINGLISLGVLNIMLIVAAIWVFMRTSMKKVRPEYVCLAALICIPLINNRTDIRPEFFSYLFMGISYNILLRYLYNEIDIKKTAYILLPIILIWVNIHIFFVIGLSLIGGFWFCSLLLKEYKNHSKHLGYLVIGAILVSCVNPGGIYGLLEPFLIFKEYGFMVAENQSVFFMQGRFISDPILWYFELLVLVFVISGIYYFIKSRKSKEVEQIFLLKLFLFVCFCVPAFAMIRFIPAFGFIAIPYFAHLLKLWGNSKSLGFKKTESFTNISIWLSVIILIICLNLPKIQSLDKEGEIVYNESNSIYRYWNPFCNKSNMGLGMTNNMEKSAEFFIQQNIQGPILNNYDIGGYLIYYLYPNHKVFVDNRPEAYSVKFFKNIFYPLHESENTFKAIDNQYNFNAIFYYRHDNTQHGQPFLIRRIEDPEWAPVFVDSWTIILLKQNEINRPIIERFKLPQSMFFSRS